jgi:hypothetical protein
MAKLFSYVVDHDLGIAPHAAGKYCTLVNCKYRKKKSSQRNIVELAEEEDWIVGTGGASRKSAGHGKIVYAMKVTEKLSLKEYVKDKRFHGRRDNQRHAPNCTNRFALISTHFYYFGRNASQIPKRFKRHPLEKKGPSFRKDFDQKFIDSFVNWLERKHERKGILGKPCREEKNVGPVCRPRAMRVVLVRVGIDTGAGGINGPLFKDRSFEFIPIPDKRGIDSRTYGNCMGRKGKPFIEYFPESKRAKMMHKSIHFDPEFGSFTYGDPNTLKSRFADLQQGDLLVFYCGLEGWGFKSEPALYIMGYFDVLEAGKANEFSAKERHRLFGENFHVRHQSVYRRQKNDLVLVKGSSKSRLLTRAKLISVYGKDVTGKRLKVLSPKMRKIFGSFGGKTSIQRSSPRWVEDDFVTRSSAFVRALR